MDYESQFAVEVISVGMMNVIGATIINSPKLSPVLKTFLVGAMIHIFSEFSGINAWYIENGAVTKLPKVDSHGILNRPYKKPPPLSEYKSCSYTKFPSSSSLVSFHTGSTYDIQQVSK